MPMSKRKVVSAYSPFNVTTRKIRDEQDLLISDHLIGQNTIKAKWLIRLVR